jgi:hypothetical protein
LQKRLHKLQILRAGKYSEKETLRTFVYHEEGTSHFYLNRFLALANEISQHGEEIRLIEKELEEISVRSLKDASLQELEDLH